LAKPVIISVDDEPEVLNAVGRDLRRHFGADYRIVKASSGAEALEAAQELKRRAVAVCLFLADQRMPGMSGTEFLARAGRLFPEAKKVLLTAYADTEAAIASINDVGLDYYLMKPWDPPERELYPVLEDLLDDWKASARPLFHGIRVVGTLWSTKCHEVKDFLSRNQIPYQWLDLEKEEEARRLYESAGAEKGIPLVFLPDGRHLVEPEISCLAEEVGLRIRAASPFYDLIIVGAGPAGLAAAVYSGSEGLRTVLIEKSAPGGQAGTSSMIENYLGFPRGLSGADLARRATVQAKRFGVEIVTGEVSGVRAEGPYRYVRLSDGSELSCHALLMATGVSVRTLDLPGVRKLAGAGIYYGAALAEAVNFRGEDVLVVGGANSAGQGAVFFSRYAREVYLAARGEALEKNMSRYLVEQIRDTSNIHALLQSEVLRVWGDRKLERVELANRADGTRSELPVSAMFIFIGAVPHTEIMEAVVRRDAEGFILTGPDLLDGEGRPRGWPLDRDPYLLETSVPGIFAAGDVRHQSVKRVASAVGEGAVAVALIHQYLKAV
jgi:thioredoxin reductase (NADPH)